MIHTAIVKGFLLVAVTLASSTALAAKQSTAEGKFYEAYYLETESGDIARAVTLYEEVVDTKGVDRALRNQAAQRLAGCREDLFASDFRRLMPPDTFGYLEIKEPNQKIKSLLRQLGVLSEVGEPRDLSRRVAVSPALIDALLGMRGVAIGINGIDPQKEEPMGVAVFHPGNLDLVRGLIETSIPIGGRPAEMIEGYPAWSMEGEALITFTRRLVIVSPESEEIAGVIRRLEGRDRDSLATREAVPALPADTSDALMSFFVDAKPIMKMFQPMMAHAASHDPEAAMMMSMLDLKSLQSLSGQVAIGDEGIGFEIELRLDEGHQNLVFNFLRTPTLAPSTLAAVPSGAAAFGVWAINPADSEYKPSTSGRSQQVVTALDIGRELFANIVGVAVFALPPTGDVETSGPPMPDLAAAIEVHDASQSQALWSQLLGIAGMASGAPTLAGEAYTLGDVTVQQYTIDDCTLSLATFEKHVLVASTRDAMAQALNALRAGKSVTNDVAFASRIRQLSPETTRAVFVHPGRCLKMAERFMPPGERVEAQRFAGLLTETVVSMVNEHGHDRLRMSFQASGIPKIDGLLNELIQAHHNGSPYLAGK